MGWYGRFNIEYNGTTPGLFENVAKIYIPNFKERFKSTIEEMNCVLKGQRRMSWYSADVDVKRIMEHMPEGAECLMKIDGETHPWVNEVTADEKNHDAVEVEIKLSDAVDNGYEASLYSDPYGWNSSIDGKDGSDGNRYDEFDDKVDQIYDIVNDLENDDPNLMEKVEKAAKEVGLYVTGNETTYYFKDEYGEYTESKHDELPEEVVNFKVNGGKVIMENFAPDIDRYRSDELGIKEMIKEQINDAYETSDDLNEWLFFIKDNVNFDSLDPTITKILMTAVEEATDIPQDVELNFYGKLRKDEYQKIMKIREVFSDPVSAMEYIEYLSEYATKVQSETNN